MIDLLCMYQGERTAFRFSNAGRGRIKAGNLWPAEFANKRRGNEFKPATAERKWSPRRPTDGLGANHTLSRFCDADL